MRKFEVKVCHQAGTSILLFTAGLPNEYSFLISKFSGVVKQDENVDVVYAVLEGYQKILKHIPQVANVIADDGATNGAIIGGIVKTVITEKVS